MATKTRTFMSPLHDLKVIVQNRVPERRDIGGRVLTETIEGKYAQFKGGRFETDDKEIIDYLHEHALFNTPRGFWEEGNAPDEPKPTSSNQRKDIVAAASKNDADKLRALVAEERGTHNRADIIELAEQALANIEVPELEEAQKVVRQDEPAESEDAVPRVDPVEPPKVEPEVEREKIIKSEEVAETRGETQAEGEEKIAAQIEAERGATDAEETENAEPPKPKKKKAAAKKRAAKKPAAQRQANTGQRTTASATAEADASTKTKASGGSDARSPQS